MKVIGTMLLLPKCHHLHTSVEECNKVNVVCALMVCTKMILQQISSISTNSKLNNNIDLVSSSAKMLLTKQREEIIVSPIQLQKLKTGLNFLVDIIMQLYRKQAIELLPTC